MSENGFRGDWLAVGIFALVQVFAAGGFVWSVNGQLNTVTTELRELNKSVGESQVVTGKIVEHLTAVDRRLESLEARR